MSIQPENSRKGSQEPLNQPGSQTMMRKKRLVPGTETLSKILVLLVCVECKIGSVSQIRWFPCKLTEKYCIYRVCHSISSV